MRQRASNLSVVLAALALLVAVTWRLGVFDSGEDDGSVDTEEVASPDDGSSTTADLTLEDRTYEVGECVTWDDDGAFTNTDVVPCSEPHLVEIVGRSDSHRDGPYPSEGEWDQIIEDRCHPLADRYLDGALDPYGILGAGAIYPTEESWGTGDRKVQCNLQLNADGEASGPPFRGRVADLDQSLVYADADCVRSDHFQAVDCATPHEYEVLSELDLSDRTTRPSDDEIFDRCGRVPGGTVAPSGGEVSITFLGFSPESWAAGSRRGNCAVAVFDAADQAVPQTGRMLPTP